MLGLLIGAAVASKVVSKVADTITTVSDDRMRTSLIKHNDLIRVQEESIPDRVKTGLSGEDFRGMDYSEAINALIGMGFKNIGARELREYKNNFFNKNMYGKVGYVSVNGDKEFGKGCFFPEDAYVLVAFHIFKDSPHVEIPELDALKKEHQQKKTPSFCEYCGGKLEPGWVNCPRCGAALK